MRILITGANGFVGSRLGQELTKQNYDVLNVVRILENNSNIVNSVAIGNIGENTDWGTVLDSIDTVIHCAARAHQKDNDSDLAIQAFYETNVNGTKKLLEACVQSGVKHFIYISSVKVMGETNRNGAFKEEDSKHPEDAYGKSKSEAENIVELMCAKNDIAYTIIRPPLVYGEGAKANLASLKKVLEKNLPIPYFSSKNRRSLIHINNLVSFISLVVKNELSRNQIFFISDGHDLSTRDIILLIKKSSESKSWVFWLPEGFIKLMFRLAGKAQLNNKLMHSLTVSTSKALDLLRWSPAVSPKDQNFI